MKRVFNGLPFGAPLCFFLVSVAYKLAWTAISSLLSQYSRQYGPQVLLYLNVAYFFPSIPVLMLQTAFNDRMDKRLGVAVAVLARYTMGLGSLVLLTYNFPALTAGSQQALLATTVLVGMSYGIAFGTSYQMASKYPPASTVALTTGFVSSGPVVLLLDLALKEGPYYQPEALATFFRFVGVITAGGLCAATALVLGSWRILNVQSPHRVELRLPYKGAAGGNGSSSSSFGAYGNYGREGSALASSSAVNDRGMYMRHRADIAGSGGGPYPQQGSYSADGLQSYGSGGAQNGMHGGGAGFPGASGYPQQGGSHAITLEFGDAASAAGPAAANGYGSAGGAGGGGGGGLASADDSKGAKKDLPLSALMARIWPAALSIACSVGTSMLIFPFFTYMRSTGLLGARFAQVLFYVRLIGDIVGRMVPRSMQASTVRGLLLWAALKLAMVPLLFGCIFAPEATGGDVGAVVVVALFWVLSGYLNTCSYVVAPTLVPPSQKPRASGLMTVAFQSACFGALLLAYWVQQVSYSMMGLGGAAAAVEPPGIAMPIGDVDVPAADVDVALDAEVNE